MRPSPYMRCQILEYFPMLLGTFNKPRRQRQRERHQTNGLMSRTMAVRVDYKSLCISSLSCAKQQHEMTKYWVC